MERDHARGLKTAYAVLSRVAQSLDRVGRGGQLTIVEIIKWYTVKAGDPHCLRWIYLVSATTETLLHMSMSE
jgi:hypothetical protein